jgi:AmmeMemoRadiSam system protein A
MSSPDQTVDALSTQDRSTLIDLARASIRHGLDSHQPLAVSVNDYPESLRVIRASFVTLNIENRLRGCIGHLEAIQPLVKDVAENAFAAAFQDPRFSPLKADELPRLEIHLSLLTPAQPLTFKTEEELLSLLTPEKDGLILEEGYHRGTFLPSVWEQLPQPKDFLRQLKIKAGLSPLYWSDSLRVSRYTTESFS